MTENSSSIEARLERIERSLEKITSNIDQAPSMMSIAADSVDELLSNAKNDGKDIDSRIKDGLHLLGRLSDPKVNASLNGLIDLLEQSPGLVSMAADSMDEVIAQSNSGPIRLDDRIRGITHVLNKLSDPVMVDKLDNLLELADQAPGLVSMTVDSIDEFMQRNPYLVEDTLSFLKQENLIFLKQAGDALTEAQSQQPAKVGGIFGLLRTLKDPDRQNALGFLMNVLKNLGKKI